VSTFLHFNKAFTRNRPQALLTIFISIRIDKKF